jgi:kelch-like protein 10
MHNFVEVSRQSDELLGVSAEELLAIVAADDLNVRNEEIVWECVLRWIERDPVGRKGHLVELMKNVRMGLMNTRYFLNNVMQHPYVKEDYECLQVADQVNTFLQSLENNRTEESELPKFARTRLFVIGGWKNGTATDEIQCYDCRADRWNNIRQVDPSGPRNHHGTAAIAHNIYVIGGDDLGHNLKPFTYFNTLTKTWRHCTPMSCHRSYVSVGELIYAIGGWNGYRRLKTAERYDCKMNMWSNIAAMNEERRDESATALNVQ